MLPVFSTNNSVGLGEKFKQLESTFYGTAPQTQATPNQERGALAHACREEEKKSPISVVFGGFYPAIYLDDYPRSQSE